MTTQRMTLRQKNAIRALPCGTCGSWPPFADGSRCHPHRLVPEKGYVIGNVVPRCPTCHTNESGHPAITAHAHRGGKRAQELHPELGYRYGAANLRKHGGAPYAAIANAALVARKQRVGLTAREMEQVKKAGRGGGLLSGAKNIAVVNARTTWEQRSERSRKGWENRRRKESP